MRAGLAALTAEYTSLAEDLASHGYVAVGFDAPYRSFVVVFPDGRVIARAPENNADLVGGPQQEQLATRLVQAWSADMGFAPLGSVIRDGVTQPFMFLLSDHTRESDAETRPVAANIRSIYDRLPSDRRADLMIPGANHFMFSDDGALLKGPLLMHALRTLGIVRLDGRRQLAVTKYCLRGFFDVYLNGAPAAALHACLASTVEVATPGATSRTSTAPSRSRTPRARDSSPRAPAPDRLTPASAPSTSYR